MNLIEVEQIYNAFNDYASSRDPDKLEALTTQNKPKTKEFIRLLKVLIPDLIKISKDKKRLAGLVEKLSGTTRRGKMIIQFIINSDGLANMLKGEFATLEEKK